MQKITKIKINKRPELFLLGIDMQKFPKKDRTIIWYMIITARILSARFWKPEQIPKISDWF